MKRAALSAVSLLALVGGCVTPQAGGLAPGRSLALAKVAHGFSIAAVARVTADMDPAMLKWADLAVPERRPDRWGRARGWETFNLATPPDLGLGFVQDDAARRLNAMMPVAPGRPDAAPPFVLQATGAERERAILCMTQAIYYEAAREPLAGQEAVAQVVINRMRHPAYPKTVCGVVYQGAERVTGCQFSFTCDGSVLRAPMASYFAEARKVAIQALSGFVQTQVGTATFYHADYVFPVWAPTLYKITQIGAHIFYRFPGPDGQVSALSGRYGGSELAISMAVRSPTEPAAPPPPGLEMFENAPIQPLAIVADAAPTLGAGSGPRRLTPDEIGRINSMLETAARGGDPYANQPASAPQAPLAPAGRNTLTPEQIGALNSMLETMQRTGVQQELPPSLLPQNQARAPAASGNPPPPTGGR